VTEEGRGIVAGLAGPATGSLGGRRTQCGCGWDNRITGRTERSDGVIGRHRRGRSAGDGNHSRVLKSFSARPKTRPKTISPPYSTISGHQKP
jgi:hypothetical protein